jgi:hypothetical protein
MEIIQVTHELGPEIAIGPFDILQVNSDNVTEFGNSQFHVKVRKDSPLIIVHKSLWEAKILPENIEKIDG